MLLHQRDALASGRGKRKAPLRVLLDRRRVAGPDADRQPSARDDVERRGRPGEQGRMTPRGGRDHGAEADRRRGCRERGERRPAVEDGGPAIEELRRVGEDVVLVPDGGEPEPLRLTPDGSQVLEGHPLPEGKTLNSKSMVGSPALRGRQVASINTTLSHMKLRDVAAEDDHDPGGWRCARSATRSIRSVRLGPAPDHAAAARSRGGRRGRRRRVARLLARGRCGGATAARRPTGARRPPPASTGARSRRPAS